MAYEYWEVNLGFEVGSQAAEYVVKYVCSRGGVLGQQLRNKLQTAQAVPSINWC
jgi:hypothetical protein